MSEAIRPKPNPHVLQKLQLHQQELGTATDVVHELLYGNLSYNFISSSNIEEIAYAILIKSDRNLFSRSNVQ